MALRACVAVRTSATDLADIIWTPNSGHKNVPVSDQDSEFEIFARAVELTGEERVRYLDEVCHGDEALRARISALIARDEQAEQSKFLAPVAINFKASLGEQIDNSNLIDRVIGPFRIVKKIGDGGMGEVYLARRMEGYKQDVAIKVLRRVVEADEMLRRFESEAQFTAALGKHPNIAGLLDSGSTEDGLLYLVMDYVDGQRIDEWCDAKKLTNEQRLDLFLQVCDAVQFAHQNAVIHRDLKPSNILVSRDGEVKLIDFGIAKLTNPQLGFQRESTRTIFRVLTPEFASPEQARGEPPTTASDVYSLGVVLYGLLTGLRPYEIDTTNPQKLLHTIENVEPAHPRSAISRTTSPSESKRSHGSSLDKESIEEIAQKRNVTPVRLKRQLNGDLSNIVLMALRKEPERRYATAAQFADDLRKYLSGHPVSARRDTIGYRVGKFIRRNRFAVTMAAMLLLTLIGGIIGTSTQWRRAQREWKRAEENALEARQEAIRANQLAERELVARVTAEDAEKKATVSARQAELKARTAQEMSDFMVRLFQGADRFGFLDYQFGPTGEEDANPTVEQLLARGKKRLDTELKDQPVVRAALKTRIAQVYLSLGDFQEADELLQTALETQRTHHADVAAPDLIETLMGLGVIRYAFGYYDMSKEYLAEAIALSDHEFGAQDPRGANAKLVYAMVTMENAGAEPGSWKEAKKVFREVVEIRENQADATAYELAHAYIGEAIVERTNGNISKAMLSMGKAGKQLLFVPGGSDYLRAWQLGLQATINWQAKENDIALQQTEELLTLLRRMLGERHPAVAHIQIDFAWRIYRAGDRETSEAYLRDGLSLARDAYGRHPRTAYALRRLGTQLGQREQSKDEARALLGEAVEIYTEAFGPDHQQTQWTRKEATKL